MIPPGDSRCLSCIENGVACDGTAPGCWCGEVPVAPKRLVIDRAQGHEQAITVRALIEQLQALPPDARVQTEGCDCVGDASGAALLADGLVLIERA